MTVELGNILKSFLEPLRIGSTGPVQYQFIDKLAGTIKVITKKDVGDRAVTKSFPVACGMEYTECIKNERYKDLIPNDKLGCIVYFEDLGNRNVGSVSGRNNWKASFRLVGWINQKKLGTDDCAITAKIVNTILGKYPELPFNSGIYQRCSIDILGQDPKSYDPFSRFSYDEEKTQYKMHPFDYFSIQLDINYSVDKRCIVEFEKQTEIICNT